MEKLPFDTISIDSGEVKSLQDTYNALKSKFKIGIPGNADHYFNKFETFNNDPGAKIGGVLFTNYPETNCYLNFIKSSYSYSSGGRGSQGGQTFI